MSRMLQSQLNAAILADFQSVANVAELSINVANVAETLINVANVWDFPRLKEILHCCTCDQDNLQPLMPFKHMPCFAFAVALAIRGGSLLCYVDTAETLAFRDSGNAFFS